MAVNESRSLNGDLREGISDGVVKKATPDRGGDQFDARSAQAVKSALSKDLYDPMSGMTEPAAARQTELQA
jgi:hypothetical protein